MSPNILKPKTSKAKSKPAKKVHKAEKQKTLKEMNADAVSGAVPTEDGELNAEMAASQNKYEVFTTQQESLATKQQAGVHLVDDHSAVISRLLAEGKPEDVEEIHRRRGERNQLQQDDGDFVRAIKVLQEKRDLVHEEIQRLKSAIDKKRRLAFKPRFKAELAELTDEVSPMLARLVALLAVVDGTPAAMLSIEAILKRRIADGRLKRDAIEIESELKAQMRGEI